MEDPRARAARTKRDRTRRALLDAADSAFGSRGWARTRVEDIAQSAGVSAATAYNHFPTKHALLAQVYAPIVNPLLRPPARTSRRPDRWWKHCRTRSEPCAGCAPATGRSRRRSSRPPRSTRSRSGGCPIRDDDADPRTLVPITEALELLIEHGQRIGELRPYPSARDLGALLVDTMLIRNVNRPDESHDTMAEMLLTVIFGALRPEVLVSAERPFFRRTERVRHCSHAAAESADVTSPNGRAECCQVGVGVGFGRSTSPLSAMARARSAREHVAQRTDDDVQLGVGDHERR